MGKPETRQRILQSAKTLFAQDGYEGVRTKQIAEASGISEVTLFKYFPSKGELYDAVLESGPLFPDLTETMASLSYTDLKADLKAIAENLADNVYKNIPIVLMRQKEKRQCNPHPLIPHEDDPVYQNILKILLRYEENGLLTVDAAKTTHLFNKLMQGIFVISMHERIDLATCVSQIHDFIDAFCDGILK